MRNKYLTLIIILLSFIILKAETYKQVRVLKADKETVQKLGYFDIIKIKPGDYVDIVADSVSFAILKGYGYPFEIIHDDLAAFYQSRYPVGTLMGGFRTYAEVTAALDSLAADYPALVTTKFSIGQSHEGRHLWAVKVSDNPYVDEDEPEIFINGLHHAREPITSEVCVEFIKELVQNYSGDSYITDLVNNNEFYILPIVNPDGYEYNRQTNPNGGGMWRKNRRNNGGSYGVDPNRNYPYFWAYDGSGSSSTPSSETYRGPSPGSEPEIQAVMNFIMGRDFAWIMNYHSYGNYLLWPWGYYDGINEDVSIFWELFGNYGEDTLGYNAGTAWQLLYNTNGDANDWGWGERISKKKTYAMTIEIGNSADGFWPSPSRIPVLINENVDALLNYSKKAYELYKRRLPPVPEITSPAVAPAGQPFYLHWQPAGIDTFNAPVSYRVHEKTGYQRITHACESSADFTIEDFSLNGARTHSGSHSFYSGQSHNRRATLTLNELLKVEAGDTLTFWTWYDIESNWDYAYVEVNTDGGEAWLPLNGNRSTSLNPNHHNEGYGITGGSGDWVQAKYYLEDYIGQQISLRFRYWTDGYTANEGIYIDDIYPCDSFSNTTLLTDYAYGDSLPVGPYSAGDYTFQVAARDDRGDISSLSERFDVEVTGELYSLAGHVYLEGAPVNLEGSIVAISGIGLRDTTDISGSYSISNIPSGMYDITASHDYYHDSVFTGFNIVSDTTMDFSLAGQIPSQPILLSPEMDAVIGTCYVNFDWTDADYAAGYIIELANDPSFTNLVANDSSVAQSSWLSPVLYNGSYFWRITAYNGFAYSQTSEIRHFDIAVSIDPPALISPADDYVSDTSFISFLWHPAEGAVCYIFELADDSLFFSITEVDSNVVDTSHMNSAALPTNDYYWRVTAGGLTVFSDPSAWRHLNITLSWSVQAPVLISPGDGFISTLPYLNFTWAEVEGAVNYLFELAVDSAFDDLIIADSAVATLNYGSDSLANIWHWWRVKASNGLEWTAYSEVRSLLVDYDSSSLYEYLPGDVNMANNVWPPQAIGADATYLIGYFRGISTSLPCLLGGLWASADANGDCQVLGSDVTRLINYFRGAGSLDFCPAYPPAWLTPDNLPAEAPSGWPGCETVNLNINPRIAR